MEYFFDNFPNMNPELLQNIIDTVVFDENGEISDKFIEEIDIPEFTYGCKHYLRRCKIISPCCNKVYPCRLCHDEDNYETSINDKHKINRYDIKEIICTNCNEQQKVKQYCEFCYACFGLYYCDICHLFDDIDKGQYHCVQCGLCRVNKNDFKHCDKCDMCVNKDCYETHKCLSSKESLCPICMTDIFNSTTEISQMKCGHYIHKKCFYGLLENTYKCPICFTSIVDTSELNKIIDQEIEITLMPEEYKDMKIKILCNDCHKESETNFHIVGLKCTHCAGYNTRKI
jgi:RING finger/CHY zinc finger protein 1